jgi:hypothetical protein
MPYTAISDFKYGLDRRRPQDSGVPGTLWLLKNAVITRGGDIERAKKFAPAYDLPEGETFGAFSVRGQIFVFGSNTTPTGMPVGVRYQQLAAPDDPDMTGVLDAKGTGGLIYAIAAYADGNVYHFYNGARVTDWDTLADAAATYETVAQRLASLISAQDSVRAETFGNIIEIRAIVPGEAFTIATDTDDNGDPSTPTATVVAVQANVPAVAEVVATGTVEVTGGTRNPGVNRITGVTVDGVQLLASPVDWIDSNDATANALAVVINNNTFVSNYTASAAGGIVTISAEAGTGTTPNGFVVAATSGGNVTTSTANMAGGVDEVDAVAQVSTVEIGGADFDPLDMWEVTINGVDLRSTGRASATGTSAYVSLNRVYSFAGSLLRFSKLNDPSDWSDVSEATGAGFINIASQAEGADILVGAAKYASFAAIFAEDVIAIYDLPADATGTQIIQLLENTGTIAPRSVVSYGANDVFYLDETGVRSLRTRDAIDSAYASDVGSAIDPFVQQLLGEVGRDAVTRASAVIEATDGRYMLALGRYIIVLSQFPASKIVAWSFIDFEEPISDLIRVRRSIFLRSGDTIYAYGGLSGDVYPDDDEYEVDVITPFISAKDPAAEKDIVGFDMAAENTWRVQIALDPNRPEIYNDIGRITDTTYHLKSIKAIGNTSHYALRFTCNKGGFALLSSTAVHHIKGVTD